MTLENQNQVASSEDEIFEQVDEHALQTILGGCKDCGTVADLAESGVDKAGSLIRRGSVRRAGRASDLKTDFTELKDRARADASTDAGPCDNYAKHESDYQALKDRYTSLSQSRRG